MDFRGIELVVSGVDSFTVAWVGNQFASLLRPGMHVIALAKGSDNILAILPRAFAPPPRGAALQGEHLRNRGDVESLCMTTQQVPPPGRGPVSGDPLPTPRPKGKSSGFASCVGLTLVAGVIIAGLISLFGGWDTILAERDKTLPVVAAGEKVRADPFDVKFLKAFQAVEAKPAFRPTPGKRWLLITMEVTNTTGQYVYSTLLIKSLSLQADGLTSEFGLDTIDPSLYRLPDGLSPVSFQPDLTQKVVAAWQQSESKPLPKELTVTLSENSYRESSLTGEKGWFDPEEKISAALTVEELKQQ